jgi:hypothetical protein
MFARLARPLILLSVLGLLASCSSTKLKVSATPFAPGDILILPPRDAHKDALPDSGAQFADRMVNQLGANGWAVSTYAASGDVGHTEPVTADQAIRCGREQGAAYALTITLGKARDAFAFSGPVPDYVWLDDAKLYDCASGAAVWSLSKPFRADSSNATKMNPSYRMIAQLISGSLSTYASGGEK